MKRALEDLEPMKGPVFRIELQSDHKDKALLVPTHIQALSKPIVSVLVADSLERCHSFHFAVLIVYLKFAPFLYYECLFSRQLDCCGTLLVCHARRLCNVVLLLWRGELGVFS